MPKGDLVLAWLVDALRGHELLGLAETFVEERGPEVALAQCLARAKECADSVLDYDIVSSYPTPEPSSPQLLYFMEEILMGFEQKCAEVIAAASGLMNGQKARSRKAARATITSLDVERKRVWDHAKSEISILIGACIFQVFADVGPPMETEGLIKQEVGDPVIDAASPATGTPAASGLDVRVFNMENVSGIIKHAYGRDAFEKVGAINGPTYLIPSITQCGTLLEQWETFGPQLDALCCIGLCARSQSLATMWAERLAQTDPELVDAVTEQRLLEFAQGLTDGRKRYVLSQLRLFCAAKQDWRKQRIESECADFTRSMLELVATGSALTVPVEQFGAIVAKLEGLVGPGQDDSFVKFIKLFLAAVKALKTYMTASSRDCIVMSKIHVAALDACLRVIAQWPSGDVVSRFAKFMPVTANVKAQMDFYVDQLRRKLEDLHHPYLPAHPPGV